MLIVNVYYIFMALNMFSKGEESIPLLKITINNVSRKDKVQDHTVKRILARM